MKHQPRPESFDLLIIGGGITGAGILWDATNRGLKAILVEKGDFASGTSSRSTKLIHGGLRYLEQLEFRLVMEVGRERAILHRLAPHLVHAEKMLLPIIRGGKLTPFTASVGIWLYDRLAGVKRTERRRMLNKEETLALVPQLDRDRVIGGALYVEYRTDDARLTVEVLKSAVKKGAMAMNYTEVTGLLYDEEEKVVGARLLNHRTHEESFLYAKMTVNAAGPWVDTIRQMDGSLQGKRIHWTKGVHLVFDQSHFPLTQAIYFDTPDGRMIFAIPREGKTYVGTTDTDYTGDPNMPQIEEEDREYLLGAINHLFPTLNLTKDHIESGWAGIRPLIHEEGKGASEISRKDEIFLSSTGLITIAGGKLTAYRKMAERTVDLVCAELNRRYGKVCLPCMTKTMPLSGSECGLDRLQEVKQDLIRRGVEEYGLSPHRAEELFSRYGENVEEIYQILRGLEGEDTGLTPDEMAELRYTWEKEFVYTPADFLIRRTGIHYFHHAVSLKIAPFVTKVLADWNHWSAEETKMWSEEMKDHCDVQEARRESLTEKIGRND